MSANTFKARLRASGFAASALLLAGSAAFAQQQVNLSAGPATATLPDGSTVPMWGYSCGAIVSGSTASCAALNPAALGATATAPAGWSPVVITVPTGQSLTINLTNKLSFTPAGGGAPNNIPTSLVIVGQLGGGLGTARTTAPSPDHSSAQANVTWPIAGAAANPGTPPAQGPRVQSFATEVAAGTTAALTWTAPRPGTYLIESGTHPSIQGPMGLYGILVVTSAPTTLAAGTAYPGVSYNADIPLLLGEIDPLQNAAVQNAVNTAGFSESATIGPNLNAPVASVKVATPGGNYATPPTVAINGGGGSGATATAIIDTVPTSGTYGQVTAFLVTNGGAGYYTPPSVVLSGGTALTGTAIVPATATALLGLGLNAVAHCSGGVAACYPPAVNYTPFYYLINGVAFDKTNPTISLFPTSPATVSGSVLVRLVNAGLRMHVPSIVGALTTPSVVPAGSASTAVAGFSLVAEDGNPVPGVSRVQSEVFLAAGKTFDVMINAPQATTTGTVTVPPAALPIFDRELSLSANAIARDGGMLAYINVNNGSLPAIGTGSTPNRATAVARADSYTALVAGRTLTVSDPAKGVIANDTNVYGVKLLTPPVNGQVKLQANGAFQYVPSANGIALSLVSGGGGYTTPVVTVAAPPAGGTTATATATVGTSGVSVALAARGSNYTAPSITIAAPPGTGGTQATATATVAGGISLAIAPYVGTPYQFPVVTIAAPDISGGTQASATAIVNASGTITGFTVVPGSGYSVPPSVTIVDFSDATRTAAGTGTGATATASLAGGPGPILAITTSNPGAGYTVPPAVSITDSTGAGASATASVSGNAGVVTSVTVTYIGSGYTTAPAVTISGGSTAAVVTASIIAGNFTSDSFTYCANGTVTGGTCSSGLTATVTLGASNIADSGITCAAPTFTSNIATYIGVKPPGVLAGCRDGAQLPMNAVISTASASGGLAVVPDAGGGFTATAPAAGIYTFTFQAQTSLGALGPVTTATVIFRTGSGLAVSVVDGADKTTTIADYRWIIEEDLTFYVDPKCTTNPLPAGCPQPVTVAGVPAPFNFGTNFHTSHMPVVATGCTGPLSCESGQTLLGLPTVCDVGNGACRTNASQEAQVLPGQVYLDPTRRYYISILPGDAAHPFIGAHLSAPSNCAAGPYNPDGTLNTSCGHGMGGAPIAQGQTAVTVWTQPSPYPTAKLAIFVFEDDYPLNGEHDAGGGIDILSPQEPGLGGFNIVLNDFAGGTGDATGQPTYDMFNQPLSNSLAGTIDPATGFDACPIGNSRTGMVPAPICTTPGVPANCVAQQTNPPKMIPDVTQTGITGMIVTCPKYESDGKTLSPMAGQAVVANLYPGRYGVVATPGADRIARGEEWLQTNTLDGQKAHDSFLRIGEPAYFQEFGPAGYHTTIGFANPGIINSRKAGFCAGVACGNELKGHVTAARMSRTPDERLFGSGSRDSFAFTQCFASLGDPDGADFAFAKCDDQGNFDLRNLPAGNWKLTIFDQWNDQIVDGISTAVGLGCNVVAAGACPAGSLKTPGTLDLGEIAAHQWQANIYTRTFLDQNGDGVSQAAEPGLALVPVNIRFRDGSFSNFNNTDLSGFANFNEVFPLFNWYVIETDSTRYKSTGVHVVYDSGGPPDGTGSCDPANAPCGSYPATTLTWPLPANHQNTPYEFMANTYEKNPLPSNLSVPGAVYCHDATCSGQSIASGPVQSSTANHSTGRIDPPFWFGSYGWQGFAGQSNFLEFGKKQFADGETGGIFGHVIYASTRPFDDPQQGVQLSWEPLVPHVRLNLYKEGVAADGVTGTLTLVDHTETSSFDDWAQGFRPDGVPNMNCAGQATSDLFFYGINNQPSYLDWYNNVLHGTAASPITIPYNSQFKCFDGMHNWNQLQPAPYDGLYRFPSITGLDPVTGKATGTNCTACIANPDASDPYRAGNPMLPAGKYVVEVVVPPGFELVKEEDKNILIGDNYIAPVTVQFPGLAGSVFIMPDQAEVSAYYNQNNAQNATNTMGMKTAGGVDAQKTEEYAWPCVGASRVVPDFISLFPQSAEVAPFAGATRNLCDRKEVTLRPQSASLAQFHIFTSIHVASHYTGIISDDFSAEFDPFSPQFGEKFSPPYMPVSVKDWAGNEVNRTYSDQFGLYNGLNYSTWEVNPPNPTGYAPTMMVTCMNDRGTGVDPDPLYQAGYSQFCYELPFMPGQTGYFDTPVVPTSAFSEGYNHPDCNYPDATPAVSSVNGDGVGPWVSAPGKTITINALGDQMVDNYGWSGPSTSKDPYNQKKVKRHYGFGAQCAAVNGTTCTAVSSVTIDGVPAAITSWTDTVITATVPAGVSACAVQQQVQYGGLPAQCGELTITSGNGKQSVDAVTVTIGGKAPVYVRPGDPVQDPTKGIQAAIDAAAPGDLIIVPPGVYSELVLMWKPVRLQGVGAATSVINANTHPSGQTRIDAWRRKVVCLFGLGINGTPIGGTIPNGGGVNAYDPTGKYTCDPKMQFQVDRLPLEATVGWTAVLNGNLAEQLIEPSLMGAYEGAGITVLGKGVVFPAGLTPDQIWASDVFPTGTRLIKPADCNTGTALSPNNPYPSNFFCNPSSIDGLGVNNSSQGGGGILVHGWGHNIQIANNRVSNNQGTLSGGITIGQGEHPDVELAGSAITTIPGSCEEDASGHPLFPLAGSLVTNQALAYCFDLRVNIHHNSVTKNFSMGDELFSSSPAGAGGVSICNGSDLYKLRYNWICGNMSTGDGGGAAHIGFSKNGLIEHNQILFNQSTNPTITTNGGGLLVMGAPDQDPPCGITTDKDCLSAPGTIGPSDGTGPGLVINANLILGNSADSGSGGGLRLQHVNGNDVLSFPNGLLSCTPFTCRWNTVAVTNNIIANNVAGWDGAGVSLLDALATNIVNNTIVSNDSTASAGSLFGSLFAPLASAPVDPASPRVNCSQIYNGTLYEQSCPQVAGLVSSTNSLVLQANLPPISNPPTFTCPLINGGLSGSCRYISNPLLTNNVIWQNRSFVIGVGGMGTGQQSQQKGVALLNASFTSAPATTPPTSQTVTGDCTGTFSYWDIGVRGDNAPTIYSSGYRLNPFYSVLTDITGYPGMNNTSSNPGLISKYCNGSRTPPESGAGLGWQVPPGTNELNGWVNGPPQVFSLTPAATVDEGNNWINLRWGPLALTHPATGATLANFNLAAGSPAIDYIPTLSLAGLAAPKTDYYGNPRPDPSSPAGIDIGAIEAQTAGPAVPTLSAVNPGSVTRAQTVSLTLTGTNLVGATSVNAPGSPNITVVSFAVVTDFAITANLAIAPGTTLGNHALTVTTPVGTSNSVPLAITAPSGDVSPLALSFAAQQVGTTSAARPVTLSNTGGGSLTINNIGFAGANPANFGQTNTCGALPATLPVGGTCTINVVFRPNGVSATPSATLNIALPGAVTTPLTVALGGTAQAPSGSVSPTALAFAAQGVGTTSAANPVTLTNTGVGPLTINNIGFGGTNPANFAQTNTCGALPATLAVGATCTVNVVFKPNAVGSRSANLNIALPGAVTTPLTVGLSGTGILAVAAFSGPSPAMNTGGLTVKSSVITLSNTGTAPLTLTAAPIIAKIGTSGSGTASIQPGGTCSAGAVVAAGGGCTINVSWAPADTTPANLVLTVTDTGAATRTLTSATFQAN